METKNMLILVLVGVLAVSTYYDFRSPSLGKIQNPQEVSFEKKQECASYKKQIEDKFEKNNNEEIVGEYNYLQKIFFSPKANSCLYIYSGSFGVGKERFRTLYLEDALSGDAIYSTTVVAEGKFISEEQERFDATVKTYETQ